MQSALSKLRFVTSAAGTATAATIDRAAKYAEGMIFIPLFRPEHPNLCREQARIGRSKEAGRFRRAGTALPQTLANGVKRRIKAVWSRLLFAFFLAEQKKQLGCRSENDL
ncbi:hypothetical protein NP603_08250 [Methylomonas sp. SURF-1]|uniref:Uncharacterized protein n=1 Tax=Methylomonas aurea TaxID=2952224 RepID=A0ABT1UFT6_9GAMM|nr:hypothetical protein [Methylomonas sp. SURF-1]MCQ8181096.1 hypothetical protein [Methylomonas sp. SURF-1]